MLIIWIKYKMTVLFPQMLTNLSLNKFIQTTKTQQPSMHSDRRKEQRQNWFKESIVIGTNLVKNHVLSNRDQSKGKKSNQKMKQIPPFSSQKLKEIQQQISKIKSNEQSSSEMNQITNSIISLMVWVWEYESLEYKSQKSKNKIKRNPQYEQDIDVSKCIRKLFQLFNKNSQFFKQYISLGRDIIQRNGIKTKLLKNEQKGSKSSKVQSYKDSYQSLQQWLTVKNYMIYQCYRNTEKIKKHQRQVSLLTLLLQITVFSYDSVVLLDLSVANSVIQKFILVNINTSIHFNKEFLIKQRILQQLIVFVFSQLHYLKVAQASSQQALSSIGKKKNSQSILWNFFGDLVKNLHLQMKQAQSFTFSIQNLQSLKTAQTLVSEFTYFMKRYSNQTGQIKTREMQKFFQVFVERVIEVEAFLIDCRQNNATLKDRQILNYRFELLLYDWALLVVRNSENQLFTKVVDNCKRLFYKYMQDKSADRKDNFKSCYITHGQYSRFTIKQDPNQFSQGKSKMEQNQLMEVESERHSLEKVQSENRASKNVLAVPHMRVLAFKEHVPLSLKRRSQKKLQSRKQVNEDSLIFLLILYNRSYIIRLLQEIQFIEPDWLDPEIGKGLVKLCTYCNRFTSLILSERYFKVLSSKPHHHNLLQSVFLKDVDHQRRISQSRQSFNSINKIDSLNSNQYSNNNEEKSETVVNHQEQVLRVRLKSCESIFFEMISQIENKVPLLKLQTYIEEALKKPQIFRAEVFYQRLLETQNTCYGREYLSELIIRWIDHQLRFFNILAYFDIFVKKCLFSEESQQFAQLIDGLPISKLIKLHSLLLAQTFNQQTNLKVSIPEGISLRQKLHVLTSGGYEQKARLVDKYFHEMTEIILWNKYLKIMIPLENQEKYVFIKSYFSLIFYSFSAKQVWTKNQQKLIFLVEKLKIDIQKDKVDEVCSTFHFLALALFPNNSFVNSTSHEQQKKKGLGEHQSSKTRYFLNCKQKIIEQLLYIIRQNNRQIIDMFKNKESMTIKYLSEDIRRKSYTETNSEVEDMKRKEVSKMLSKQKVMHDFMIKTIVRLIQNIDYTQSLLKNFHSPEDFISITAEICKREYLSHDQKFVQSQKTLYSPKLNYFLSSVSSSHQFEMGFRRELKRFEENFEKYHNRYGFLIMIRFIADKWVQEKNQAFASRPSQRVKSKQSKTTNNDSKNKQKNPSITNFISIQNIFKICLEVIEIRFGGSVVFRQSEVLKQKMICLETICFLSNFIIQNIELLHISSLSVVKAYRTNIHSKVGSIIVRLLMNNEAILGKNERQLVLHIRLQVLSYLIENYANNISYDSYEWRLMKDRRSFWFLIDCLIFDKSAELRFYIIKSSQSRFNSFPQFRAAMCQKLTMFELMAVEEPHKMISQLIKKALYESLEYSLSLNSNKCLDLLLSSLIGCIQFMVNFNLMNMLQRDEKRLSEKLFFQMLIDLIFEKGDMDSYLFSLVQNFKSLLGCKSGNQLLKQIKPLQWDHITNIEFYLTSKTRIPKFNPIEKDKHQNKKMYLQLINQLKQQTDSQSYSQNIPSNRSKFSKNSKKSAQKKRQKFEAQFLQLLVETIKVVEEVFKVKLARCNRKFVRTRKAIGLIFDTPIGPNLLRSINSTNSSNKPQPITISYQNLRQFSSDIEI